MNGRDGKGPPFVAEHVGSFVRPERLLQAARAYKAGTLPDAAYREIQDACIAEIVAFQDDVGMPSVTDGEFRRRVWSAGFTDAVDGIGMRAEGILAFRTEKGEMGMPPSPYAEAKLRRKHAIVVDDFAYVKSLSPGGLPKVTIAAPDVMHLFLGPRSFDPAAYGDRDAYFADLARIYREEIAELGAAGCTYLQLDDTALPCLCDASARQAIAARGEDPDELARGYVALINAAIDGRPAGMAVALHMCRGNLKGAWMAEGGYEAIAEPVFGGLEVDGFLLEYDTPRAGDFAPLRALSGDQRAVLGLVSTKTPMLESKDELKRRIDEAARVVPLERLGLSPQCGFSSGGGGGQVITEGDTRRKLELVRNVAAEVWG